MTNREVREWYLHEVARIAEMDARWNARGDSLEERALKAWHSRHDLRMRAREMMENPDEADALRARDQLKYGRSNGPTFEDLKKKLLLEGRSIEEALTMILEGARSTSPLFNRLLGIEPGSAAMNPAYDESVGQFDRMTMDRDFRRPIRWEETGDPVRPYAASVEAESWVVRLNDFPDEDLYTLLKDGRDAGSFDEWPDAWTRPEHSASRGSSPDVHSTESKLPGR